MSLTGLRSISRILTLPRLKASLLEEALRNEAEREMPVPLEELYLAWQRLDSNNAEEIRFSVLGVPRNLVDSRVSVLRKAGIRPYGMVLKPLALAALVDREEAIVIDLEPDSLDIVVVADSFPTVMRSLTVRGNSITTEDRVRYLADELSRVVDFHNNSQPEHPLTSSTPVVLTGSLAGDARVRDLIRGTIANPLAGPSPAIEYPPTLPVWQYAVNMGLAVGQVSASGVRANGRARVPLASINVLPEIYRAHPPQRISLRHILYPMAAVLTLAALASLYLAKMNTDAQVGSIQAELAHAKAQLARAEETLAAVKATEAEAKRLNDIRQALFQKSTLAEDLRVILGSLPLGVRLSTISQTAKSVSLEGTGDNEQAVLDYARSLEATERLSKAYVTSLARKGDASQAQWVTFTILADK